MKLDLSKYSTECILGSYEFIFSQWCGGMATEEEILEIVPTVYIFGEVLNELRAEYTSRKDCDLTLMKEVEMNVVKRVTVMMSIPEKQLRIIYENMAIGMEQRLKEMREKLKNNN